jgi:hypothetical protein
MLRILIIGAGTMTPCACCCRPHHSAMTFATLGYGVYSGEVIARYSWL